MFERFGRVTRVFLAKDRETNRAKGFAFISFQERTDAAKACEKMDGCKSDLNLPLYNEPLADMKTPQMDSVTLFFVSNSPKDPPRSCMPAFSFMFR